MKENIKLYKDYFQVKSIENLEFMFKRYFKINTFQEYLSGIKQDEKCSFTKKYMMNDYKILYEKFKYRKDFDVVLYFFDFAVDMSGKIFSIYNNKFEVNIDHWNLLKHHFLIEEIFCAFHLDQDKKQNYQRESFSEKELIYFNDSVFLEKEYRWINMNYISLMNNPEMLDDFFNEKNKLFFEIFWSRKNFDKFKVICMKLIVLRMYFTEFLLNDCKTEKMMWTRNDMIRFLINGHNIRPLYNSFLAIYYNKKFDVPFDYVNLLFENTVKLDLEKEFIYHLLKNRERFTILENGFVGYYFILKRAFVHLFISAGNSKIGDKFIHFEKIKYMFITSRYKADFDKIR